MRIFLPLIAIFLIPIIGVAQPPPTWEIASGEILAGVHSDPDPITTPGYITTNVATTTSRNGGVRYNHLNQIFKVDGGWITQFNDGPFPIGFGRVSTNTDYFLYQGTNEISGTNGIITFDTVHFDIGLGNTMNITNYRSGTLSPLGEVSGGITVAAGLYFNNGLTTTNRLYPVRSAIVFVNSAFYVGGLSDAQHVDGFVSEVNYPEGEPPLGHSGVFTFPVGNSTSVYQLRRQGAFETPERLLTVGWVDGDPNTTDDPTQGNINFTTSGYLETGISSVIPLGFWDWHYQDATVLDPFALPRRGALPMPDAQTITVSIPALNVDFSGFTASDLRLIGYDAIDLKWINLSGTTGATGLTKGSTLQGVIPTTKLITALAIGSTVNFILPVTFNSFTVKSEGCKALLQWETSSEQNNSHFTVERSTDGSTFTAIARVGAVGNSSNLNTYKYTDEAPAGGINYYRITQVDFDGKHSSTEIKAVKIQCNGGNEVLLRAYPNPATNQVYIQTGKPVARVNILSSNGQTVLKYIPSQTEGGGTFPVNIQRLQRGIYLLQLVNKDGTVNVVKLLKQ